MKPKKGETRYSAQIDGCAANYKQPVRFDVTDGFVGITQWTGDCSTRVGDRVLLSPAQIRGLLKFLRTTQTASPILNQPEEGHK